MGNRLPRCAIAEMNAGCGIGKFKDALAARAAGIAGVAFDADNRDVGDFRFACCDHRRNSARFGAGACGIGGVLDIAACDDLAGC